MSHENVHSKHFKYEKNECKEGKKWIRYGYGYIKINLGSI